MQTRPAIARGILQLLRQLLLRFGVVTLRTETWEEFQANLASLQSQLTNSTNELAARTTELASVRSQQYAMELGVTRAQARVEAVKRWVGLVHAQLRTSNDLLRDGDGSGRIRQLEEENCELRKRLGDLEAYLKETRETTSKFFL